MIWFSLLCSQIIGYITFTLWVTFRQLLTGTKRFGKQGTHHVKVQSSSLLSDTQKWLLGLMSDRSSVWEVHCSRDGSRGLLQTTFASQVDHVRRLFSVCPWCCRAAILGLLVFFLELCIFSMVFLFWILELPIMPFSPTLSLQFHLVSLHGSILCRLFQLLPLGQQISQKSELGLHKYCCVHAGSWITDSWTTARRVTGTTGYSGKLLTFSSEEPSLSLSDHVAAREQRAETHT